MSFIEITILGIGLAMDAACVSMTNGMVYKNLKIKDYIAMPLFFGVFQGLMPVLGYFAGTMFSTFITKYSGMVIFLILAVIGGNMIRESLKTDSEAIQAKRLTASTLFFQAVATSIDAFAVGVGFCAVNVSILPASGIIALITALIVIGAILIGRKFGDIFECKAGILGGMILIIIGVKAIL